MGGLADAGGVEEDDLQAGFVVDGADGAARGLGDGRDDGHFLPMRALSSDDLPVLARPTMAASPARKAGVAGVSEVGGMGGLGIAIVIKSKIKSEIGRGLGGGGRGAAGRNAERSTTSPLAGEPTSR